MCGAVKLESVEGTGNFLMDTMTMMFIPATVGIVECIGEVRAVLVPFLIIIGISTLLVMAVTGCMAQWSWAGNTAGRSSDMREGIRLILEQTQYFGLVLSIGAYLFACWLKNKTKLAILNPLLVSAA